MNLAAKEKIVFVVPYFKPHTGGLENYVANIEKGLRTLGWETVVITSNDIGKSYQEDFIDGTKIYRLPTWFKISNTPVNPMWYFMLRKIFKKENPSIINAHAPVPFMADMAALTSGTTPFVLTYHAGTMKKNKFLFDVLIAGYENTLLRYLASKATMIICPSQFVIDTILKRYKEKASVVTPGVDTTIFKPTESVIPENKTVLFIARFANMYKMKGLYYLIDAVSRLPGVTLKVIGEPIETHAKNVIFLGKKSAQDTAIEMQKCSVFVLPSLAHAESFGMVLIEAMACRKPVIGTRIGGIPEVIADGVDGCIVKPGDSGELADAIERILNDGVFANSLALKGIQKATNRYSWKQKIEETDGLIKKLISRKHKSPIIYLSAYYPPHTGGMEIVAKKVAEHMAATGDRNITVLTTNCGNYEGKRHESKATCRLKLKRLWSFEFAHTPIAPMLPWHLSRVPKNSIAHIHLAQAYWPEFVWLVKKTRGLRYVVHFHLDVGPSGFFGRIFLMYKKHILGHVLRDADRVIVFSNTQSGLVQNRYGVKKINIAIIPNGVGEEYFYREVRPVPKDRLQLLYVGRLSVQKRVDRLIDMLALLKIPVQLTIVGDGEEKEKLEAQAHRLGLINVTFEGKKNGEELRAYYRNADVFVIASDVEGMPLVVLEAMASGLPIVASNVLGLSELVADVGVLVDNPSPQTFSNSISNLWQQPGQLQKLSKGSLKKADQYTWEKLAVTLEEVYDKL